MTKKTPQETFLTATGAIPKIRIARIGNLKRTCSHDAFFKKVMRDVETARHFLMWLFREDDLCSSIDLSRLETQKETLQDEKNQSRFADVLLKAPLRQKAANGAEEEVPLYIFFLFEHKSFNDRMTTLQILHYQIEIWSDIESRRTKTGETSAFLLFILPIIVHHGPGPFTSPTNLRDLITPVGALEQYLPSFPCKLVDIRTLEQSDYPGDWELNAFFTSMKAIFSLNIVDEFAKIIHDIEAHLGEERARNFLRTVVHYYLRNSRQFSEEEWNRFMETLGRVFTRDTINTIQPWWVKVQAEGRAKGRAEGMAKGRAEGEAKGKAEEAIASRRDIVLSFLADRLGTVPQEITERIGKVTSKAQLDQLIKLASRVTGWEEFTVHLPR